MDSLVYNSAEVGLHQNQKVTAKTPYPNELNKTFNQEMCKDARKSIRQWKGYEVTPLISLEGFASSLGIQSLHYKDESSRFGLGSFKSLGGAYAVLKVLQRELQSVTGKSVSTEEILEGKFSDLIEKITVVTATDGNHGRSVAWGAQLFGCHARIYIHQGVSQGRADAIAQYGAEVIWVKGNYDDSVIAADEDAKKHGWFLVSDTSYEGYTDLPRYVLAGYTVMTQEIMEQSDKPFTHVFVQGGVGGLASAVFGDFWQQFGENRPYFIVVEPELADCLYQSSKRGERTTVNITEETIMAGLSCGEVSLLSWEILEKCVDHFMTIPDDFVAPTMRLLAKGAHGADPIVSGESAVGGLAGLIAARQSDTLSNQLQLDENSRVLVIGTEGATDPEIYQTIIAG